MAAGRQYAMRALAEVDYSSWRSVVSGTMARTAQQHGVPEWVVEPLRESFALLPEVIGSDLVNVVSDQVVAALKGTAVALAESIGQAATAVPIVGAIVNIGIQLGLLIRRAVLDGRDAGKSPERDPYQDMRPLEYSYEADSLQGSAMLALSSDRDLTPLFLPPSASPTWELARVQAEGGGHRWWAVSEGDIGLLPGLSDQVGVYEWTLFGIRTIGAVMPSGRKFATTLWQQIMKPGVSMFAVDSLAIEDAWSGYYASLWDLASRPFGATLTSSASDLARLRGQIYQSASMNRYYECREQWVSRNVPRTGNGGGVDCAGKLPYFAAQSIVKGFSREKLLQRLPSLSGLYSDIVRYVCIVHRERAMAALDTLWTAYVPADSPLMLADTSFARRQIETRQLLLRHPARWRVELDLVPDGSAWDSQFRSALVESRRVPDPVLSAPSGQRAVVAGDAPRMEGGASAGPPPPPVPVPGEVDEAPARSGGAAVAVGVGLGLLGVAAVMRRRRGR